MRWLVRIWLENSSIDAQSYLGGSESSESEIEGRRFTVSQDRETT